MPVAAGLMAAGGVMEEGSASTSALSRQVPQARKSRWKESRNRKNHSNHFSELAQAAASRPAEQQRAGGRGPPSRSTKPCLRRRASLPRPRARVFGFANTRRGFRFGQTECPRSTTAWWHAESLARRQRCTPPRRAPRAPPLVHTVAASAVFSQPSVGPFFILSSL